MNRRLSLSRAYSIGRHVRFRWYVPREYWIGARYNFQCDWWEVNLFFGFLMFAVQYDLIWEMKHRARNRNK